MTSSIQQLREGISVVGNSTIHACLAKGVIVDLRDKLHMICGTPDGRFRLTARGECVRDKLAAGVPVTGDDFRE
jgi:hypothetical protein